MVRFIVMIVVAILALLAPASAAAQVSKACVTDMDCRPHEVCKTGGYCLPVAGPTECDATKKSCIDQCVEDQYPSREWCCGPFGPKVFGKDSHGYPRDCVGGGTGKPRKTREEYFQDWISRVPADKLPKGEQGPKGDTGEKGDTGAPGKGAKVTQATDGAIVEDGSGNTAIIKNGKDGTDRPLNAEVGMVTGLRLIGATPVFNLGADLKLIFKDLWYLKFAWEFGTALIDHDDRQFQSVVQAALGLRLDAFSPNLGLDLGIGAEYSQTGTLPFGGWDRRSWTAKIEADLYPLVWAGVADEWKRFFKFGVSLGLGEEFKPGSTGAKPLFDTTGYLGVNAVF